MRKGKRTSDALDEALAGVSPGDVARELTKSEAVTIRVTAAEKEEMKAAAQGYGLTLTDYLCRLHAIARARAKASRPAPKAKPKARR